jgi:hypothetical protein
MNNYNLVQYWQDKTNLFHKCIWILDFFQMCMKGHYPKFLIYLLLGIESYWIALTPMIIFQLRKLDIV